MKKIIKERNDGVIQVTTLNERWYVTKEMYDDEVPFDKNYVPSSSWIASHLPMGEGYYRYIGRLGYYEAQRHMRKRGVHGTKVHKGIEAFLREKTVTPNSKFLNPEKGYKEELTVNEYSDVCDFKKWYDRFNPDVIAVEVSFINENQFYGGTIDLLWELHDTVSIYGTSYYPGLYVTDHKTSKGVYLSHKAQVSSYKHGLCFIPEIQKEIEKRGYSWTEAHPTLLQVGYSRNSRGYKMHKVEDKFDVFLAARRIWQEMCGDKSPKEVELPGEIKLQTTN